MKTSKKAQERKNTPVYSGALSYFPDAIKYIGVVSKAGNDQHHKGSPLHWDRTKSTDQLDAGTRHLIDHAKGDTFDDDGIRHLGKAAWRLLAQLQLDLENDKTN